MEKKGRVFWITGLSGAGKTTIGKHLVETIKDYGSPVVFLDGDELRKTIAEDVSYTKEDQIKAGYRYCKLANMLAEQGFDVVVATVAMFHCLRDWNRENIRHYIEIYLMVERDVLIQRNQKGLYTGAMQGKVKNVMGMDVPIEEPKNPDIIIENDGRYTIRECVKLITDYLGRKRERNQRYENRLFDG